MMHRLLTVLALLLCTACGDTPSSAPGSKRLRVQLDWVPEPEFGGLYAAQQDGLFAAAGLEVEIIKGGAGTPTPQLTADGVCDIGLMSADQLLQLRARDGALVGFYATFIETPYALMAHDANPAQSLEQLWTGGGTIAVGNATTPPCRVASGIGVGALLVPIGVRVGKPLTGVAGVSVGNAEGDAIASSRSSAPRLHAASSATSASPRVNSAKRRRFMGTPDRVG